MSKASLSVLQKRIERLEVYARHVLDNWDQGDLAAAVRNLESVLSE